MNLQPGIIIKATEQLNGSIFSEAIILVAEVNNDGAVGFITNKIFHRRLNELAEFNSSPPIPLYDGGPVDKEHLFFLHQRPDVILGGRLVKEHTYIGGDFKHAVQLVNANELSHTDIRIFVGYCGWDAGELQAEIAEGSWTIDNSTFCFG